MAGFLVGGHNFHELEHSGCLKKLSERASPIEIGTDSLFWKSSDSITRLWPHFTGMNRF